MNRSVLAACGLAIAGLSAAAAWWSYSRVSAPADTIAPSQASQPPTSSRVNAIGAPLQESSDAIVRSMLGKPDGSPLDKNERLVRIRALGEQLRVLERLLPRESFDLDAVAA